MPSPLAVCWRAYLFSGNEHSETSSEGGRPRRRVRGGGGGERWPEVGSVRVSQTPAAPGRPASQGGGTDRHRHSRASRCTVRSCASAEQRAYPTVRPAMPPTV